MADPPEAGRGACAAAPLPAPFPPPDLVRFHLFDRRCRAERVEPIDRARLAGALLALGERRAAAEALGRVEAARRHDADVLRWLMDSHPRPAVRLGAARALAATDRASRSLRASALRAQFDAGAAPVLRARRRGAGASVEIAWRGPGIPAVVCRTERGAPRAVDLAELPLDCSAAGVDRAQFRIRLEAEEAVEVSATSGAGRDARVSLPPAHSALAPAADPPFPPAALTVLVPAYGDPDSLAACLDALGPQLGGGVALAVVDDASPDGRVSGVAERACRAHGGLYLRNGVNLGFAAAVNRGLARCASGDVLVLNSDVILPEGALERLRAASRQEPDIGTVSPLSNDAGEASFPDPHVENPPLPPDERARVDDAARRANAGLVVDALAPHGSCLYVTRACLDRVGLFSLRYGRGYYEDVDLCLRAREAGLRNVVACDVYATHLGGRSFGLDRRALVTRNHHVVQRRFPDYERDEKAFAAADPLRAPRAAIERALGLVGIDDAVVLVARAVTSEALVAARIGAWRALGRSALVLRWFERGGALLVSCVAPDHPWPRSLRFEVEEAAASGGDLADWLIRAAVAEIEVLEPDLLPAALRLSLAATGLPVAHGVAGVGSAASVSPMGRGGGMDGRPGAAVRAFDSMAGAVLAARTAPPAGNALREGPARRGGREIRMLGIVVPTPTCRAEALVLTLARHLRRRGRQHLVVLGQAIDEAQLIRPGNVWVVGPIGSEDPVALARLYRVEALLSPHRDGGFWCVESLARSLGVPRAYFDWSRGLLEVEPGDLRLDPESADADVCGTVAAWCAPRSGPDRGAAA